MSAYIDASVILPMLVTEGASDAIDAFMEGLTDRPVVSEYAAGETASALSRLVRMNQLDAADVRARLLDFDSWRASDAVSIDTEAADIRLAAIFVRRLELGMRMPDAVHAAMCHRLGHMLVTLDLRLAGAASALGIAITVPG